MDESSTTNNEQQQQQQEYGESSSNSVIGSTTSSLGGGGALGGDVATTSSSLEQIQLLVPPVKTLGDGPTALRYSPQSAAWHCTFSRNGEWLAACFGAPDPCICVWKLDKKDNNNNNDKSKNNNNQWILHSTLTGVHERTIRTVAFAPLSASYVLAAASFDATVSLWEYDASIDAWDCTTQLEGHENEVKSVTWNSTGSLLASCGRDKTVWLWETFLDGTIGGTADNDLECIAVLNGHDGDVKCVQFASSHGQWGDGDEILLSAGYDDTIKIWAEDTGDWYCAMSINDIHKDTIWSLAVAPSSGRVVSASADGSIAILKSYTIREKKEKFPDQASGSNGLWKCVGTLPGAHASTIYSIAYAPAKAGHGRIASGGADNRIQIYREVAGSTSDHPMFALDATTETNSDVNCVCWHPWDGSILCTAGDDGSVRIWRFEM